jgi:hypothetical protein
MVLPNIAGFRKLLELQRFCEERDEQIFDGYFAKGLMNEKST